jgi:hypothetical protein
MMTPFSFSDKKIEFELRDGLITRRSLVQIQSPQPNFMNKQLIAIKNPKKFSSWIGAIGYVLYSAWGLRVLIW